ncbi:MAG: hypothetical protein OHK0056_28850 [Bacteriovoracaceae bacterium]
MKKVIIVVFCFSFIQSAFASIAKVKTARGKVTRISPGMKEAAVVQAGDQLQKDTSILTQEKSFAIIVYNDGTQVTLGPNSKMIVDKIEKSEQQLVSLITGKIKAEVKKAGMESKTSKLILKTRSAALGVRGTVFQTTYNPESKITSLVTLEGKVAMAKVPEKQVAELKKMESQIDEAKKIDQILNAKAVVVERGEYAGVSENLARATEPVTIAPEQVAKLKLNQTLGAVEEKIEEKEIRNEIEKTVLELAEKAKTKEVKKEARYDPKTEKYTPRPGGFVDIDSGLYVPPAKNSEYDEKLKVFEATEKIGTLTDDGLYKAPVGLKLEAGKGFVIVESSKSEEVVKIAKELNQEIAGQIIKPSKSKLEDLGEDTYEKYFNADEF